MSAHARLMPSAFHITVPCPGSVTLQEGVPPDPETDEEAEGTAAHFVALQYAAGNEKSFQVGAQFTSGGRNWIVDLDMATGAKIYAKAIGPATPTLRLEDPVRLSRVHTTECWGTPDAWQFFPAQPGLQGNSVLRIYDYKYGHRFVEVFENLQLIGYLVGVMERLNLSDMNVFCELILVQPRAYHREGPVRTWQVHATELRGIINQIANSGEAALGPNPPTRTGLHCIDCKARHVCTTFQYSVANIVDYSGHAEAANMTPHAMGQELRILWEARKRLEARYEGIAMKVEALIRNGQSIPLWKLEAGRSKLEWLDNTSVEEVAALGELLNVNLRKPPALITPTQAVAAGIDEKVIEGYASRKPGGVSLKPDTTLAARKVFTNND